MTENLIFEEVVPFFKIKGHCHTWEGMSTQEWPAKAPDQIIQLDQNWFWAVHFKQTGPLTYLMGGTWRAELFLEQMGGGEFSMPISERRIEFPFKAEEGWNYKTKQIGPRIVPAGVYRAVVSLTFRGLTGRPGPIAAFADMGMLQFYED